jgi:hypothetical protein
MTRGSRETRGTSEVERYRTAAKLAIEQLDWAINYLYKIGKREIAEVLRRNRATIADSID